MRWALALGWLGVAGLAWGQAPVDLDSPFSKTALIQEKSGEITERIVRKGKRIGDVLEFQRPEGGLLVVPEKQVIAVLPKFPSPGSPYLQSDVQRAIQVLLQAQGKFPQRSEVAPEVIANWQALTMLSNEHDRIQSKALREWMEKCSRISSDMQNEDLEILRAEGIEFLGKFPTQAKEIEKHLKGLKDLSSMDLGKVDSVELGLGSLGEKIWVGIVLWALLIVPLFTALIAFSGAIHCFRHGVILAGLLRLLLAVATLAFWVGLLLDGKEEVASSNPTSSAVARKATWLLLNHQKKWVNQGSQKISLPPAEWLGFLEEKSTGGNGTDTFPYWYLAKPQVHLSKSFVELFQPIRIKFVSLPFRFWFSLPKAGESLDGLEFAGGSIGKIPLGATFGHLVWQILQPCYQPFFDIVGISQGVRWLAGEDGMWVVEIPMTKKPVPQPKELVSARELAEVFDQGFGEIYFGRVIAVEGILVEVSSIQETLGDGTKLEKQDPMDEFTLEGIPQGPGRRYAVRIRCQFKSSEAYFLDSKGDLFKSFPQTQIPSSDIPLLRRIDGHTRVRISEGRVESKPTETRLITLYDCRKVEGFNGKDWNVIWESKATEAK